MHLYQIRPRVIRLDAAYWGLRLIAWIHAVLGAVAVVAYNPKNRRTAPACLPPGPEKNWANEVPSNASLVAFFSFFTCNVLPCVAGLRLLHRSP